MIKANHKAFWIKFSKYYSRLLLNIYFRNIRFKGEYAPSDLPVLLISNHFTWWDGFIHVQLINKYIKRKLYFMMLEHELKKAKILTKIGAYSIDKNSYSSLDSIRYTVDKLEYPGNVVLLFPQGEIQSLYIDKFVFEKGLLTYILKKVKSSFQLVMNLNLIDYNNRRRPELTIYFKTMPVKNSTTYKDIEDEFNAFAGECLKEQRNNK